MRQWKYTKVLYDPETDMCYFKDLASRNLEESREEMVEIFGRQGWECTEVKKVMESDFTGIQWKHWKDTQWKYWIHFQKLQNEDDESPEEREERVSMGKDLLEFQLKTLKLI